MTVTSADELGVGDETLDPVSGCTCVVTSTEQAGAERVLTMRGSEGQFTLRVPRAREMSLRKKNDPFDC